MKLSDFNIGDDGYLVDREDWTEEFAKLMAEELGLVYGPKLEEIVRWSREQKKAPDNSVFGKEFFKSWEDDPERRDLIPKTLSKRKKYVLDRAVSLGQGMKLITRIAGLPKPTGCV